jgi:hypothetical protein
MIRNAERLTVREVYHAQVMHQVSEIIREHSEATAQASEATIRLTELLLKADADMKPLTEFTGAPKNRYRRLTRADMLSQRWRAQPKSIR